MTTFSLVPGTETLASAIAVVRDQARSYGTNLFPGTGRLANWCARGELTWAVGPGALLLLRRDRWFEHLYFCAADPGALAASLAWLGPGPVTTDLVGTAETVQGSAAIFSAAGFRAYARLQRMVRLDRGPRNPEAEPDVELAQAAEAPALLRLMEDRFDPLKEQLPRLDELAAAAAAGQVLVARAGETLAGLLYFEQNGMSSTLRYWLVDPAYRDLKFGARLMRGYVRRCPEARRFLLWVIDANVDAIAKYRHYGYAQDGLIDQVMIKQGEAH